MKKLLSAIFALSVILTFSFNYPGNQTDSPNTNQSDEIAVIDAGNSAELIDAEDGSHELHDTFDFDSEL